MQTKYINEIKKILKIPPNISSRILQEIYGRYPCNFSLGSTFLFCSESKKEHYLFINGINDHLKKDGTIAFISSGGKTDLFDGSNQSVRAFSTSLNYFFPFAEEELQNGASFIVFDIKKSDLQELTTNVTLRFSLQKLQSMWPNKTFFFFVNDISKKEEINFFFLARSSAIILLPKSKDKDAEDLSFIVIKNRIHNFIKGKRIFINK